MVIEHSHFLNYLYLYTFFILHFLICDIANLNRLKREIKVILTTVKKRDKQKKKFVGVFINVNTTKDVDILLA